MPSGNGIAKIVHTARFLKSPKRLPRSIQKKVKERDVMFRKNPFGPRLETHKLHGRFRGFWAYSVDHRYRVIFVFRNSQTAIYYEVGDHAIYS